MRNDDTELYQESRQEWLLTRLISGLTLAVLAGAGYFAPDLLVLAGR